MNQFRERQRGELLRQSARGLLWERVSTYMDYFVAPKWVTAAATAAVCLFVSWTGMSLLRGPATQGWSLAAVAADMVPAAPKPSLAVDSPLMKEAEGQPIEIETILLSRHFESDPQGPQVAGVGTAANPAPKGYFPVLDLQ